MDAFAPSPSILPIQMDDAVNIQFRSGTMSS